MSREEWDRHMADLGFKTRGVTPAEAAPALQHMRSSGCAVCKTRRRQAQAQRRRRDREQVLRSLGLVKTPYGWE